MNSIISSMNDILIDWKKEHDIFDSMYLSFCESNGFLCFRDFPLCKLEDHLELVSVETTTESIDIHLNDNQIGRAHV